MKKFLLILATLCFSATMWAQSFDDGTFYYEVIVDDEGEATDNCQIVAPTNGAVYDGEDITIPATASYNGKTYNVTRIDAYAFNEATISGKLVIPGTLLNLGQAAFNACTGLELVEFEASTQNLQDENTELYSSSFNGCDNVYGIVLHRDITNGKNNAAVSCFAYVEGIQWIYIGEEVTEIPQYFARSNKGLSLMYVISDAAVPPTLDETSFDHHNASTFLFYTKADYLNDYKADSGWKTVFGKDNMHAYDGPDPDEPVNELAFLYNGLYYEPNFGEDGEEDGTCSIIESQDGDYVYSGEITIPATATNEVEGAPTRAAGTTYRVTRIGEAAFADSEIEGRITIPSNINTLGVNCFSNCVNLTEAYIEYSPESLYEENTGNMTGQSFSSCSGLISVYMNRDFTNSTGASTQCTAFNGMTSIQHVFVGRMVTYIPQYMFRNTQSVPSLVDVVCYAEEPPTLSTGVFNAKSPANYESDPVLYVYDDYIDAYYDSDWYGAGDWYSKDPIQPIEDSNYDDMPYPFDDTTGISIISADSKSAKVSGIYNIAGQRVNENAKGLLIKDGKKVLVK